MGPGKRSKSPLSTADAQADLQDRITASTEVSLSLSVASLATYKGVDTGVGTDTDEDTGDVL
jgi:hypothetical protein